MPLSHSTIDAAPRAQVAVAGGLPIGFEKGEDGRVFALANQKRIPLPDGAYSWQTVADDGQPTAGQWLGRIRDRAGATAEDAGKVIGVPIMAALLVCMLPIFLIGLPGGP
jgi:hypothetical protein